MPAEYEIWTVDHDPNIDVHKDAIRDLYKIDKYNNNLITLIRQYERAMCIYVSTLLLHYMLDVVLFISWASKS